MTAGLAGSPRAERRADATVNVGFWSALCATALGISYALAFGYCILTRQLTMPPPEFLQIIGALVSLGAGPLLVTCLAAVHCTVPAERRLFSLLGVLFATAFMILVSINRFVQLAVVRISAIKGDTSGLERFMPYGDQSAMLALEMAGWGFFLSLALLCTAFAFAQSGIERRLRWTFLAYAIVGLFSTVALVVGSPLSAAGFVAWGFILPVGSGLLSLWFRSRPVPGRDNAGGSVTT